VPPLFVLPDIVKAVGHKMDIFVDCGILSGSDAYKAMALGAKAVSVGIHLIPFVKQGAEAVANRINDMTAEMKGIMAHTGVKDVKSFDAGVVYRL
jgi:isopentenyl diphosphate isomerase/L-lactate dehydrogenase-like FMN-dependent dehydrogenase